MTQDLIATLREVKDYLSTPYTKWERAMLEKVSAELAKAEAQPKHEPVAWLTRQTRDGKRTLELAETTANPRYVEVHSEWIWEPLYAAPQPAAPAVPLSDKQMNEVIAVCYGYSADFEFHQCLARAIEKAHGIVSAAPEVE